MGADPLPSPTEPPPNPARHAKEVDLARMLKPGYWRKLCPQLHVADKAYQSSVKPMQGSDDVTADARESILRDGYTKIPAACLRWKSVDVRALALGVVQLMQHGWHPSFLLMFDEAWAVAHELSDIIHAATGNRLNFDALCWHVDPADANPSAFSPHRDRQPDDAPATFRADGTAMYATAWVPFTDAKPENSCLYVIPRPHDPGYFQGDDDDPTVDKDPLQLCLPRKEAYQHITAIPAEAGSAVVFTHRIIHWGSRGRGRPASYEAENANSQTPLPPLEPRVCISFGFADDAYEPAYVSRAANLPFPPMAHRAALVSAQSIAYHERFHPGVRMLRLMHDAVTNPAVDGVFEAKYRKKVMFEYVQAAAAAAGGAGGKGMNKNASKAKAAAGASGASGASGDNSLAGRGRKMHPTPSRGTGVGADDDDDDGEDDSDGDKLEGEEEDDDDEGADDAMERALEAMIDAKMDGAGDNFVDDFDNFEDGVLEDEDGVSLVEPAALSSGKKRKKNGGGGVGMSSGGGKKRR